MLHGKLVFFWGGRLLFWAATAGVAPHTSFLAFFFLTGATWRLVDSLGGSAHAISCFFLFDGCYMTALDWGGRLRTRHFLLFSF